MERLDKYLANAGTGTRSEVKKYAKAGRITVNGEIVKSTDLKIDPQKDIVLFDGTPVLSETFEYHVLYKPQGCITATSDSRDRTVMDYISSTRKEKLFPVGRLDKDTEGLLLITDDGDLAHKLLAPKKHVQKSYFTTVTGSVTAQEAEHFEEGLDIGDDKPTLPASLEILERRGTSESAMVTDTIVTISEGRFHQIKRMFHAIGHEVVYLKRLSMGSLMLDETMKPGDSRRLNDKELTDLLALK